MKFEDQAFSSDITLDYNEFIRCTFTGCTFHFGGGQYQLTDCRFEGGGAFTFHDAAQRTLSVLQVIQQVAGLDTVRQLLEGAPPPGPLKLN